MEAKPGEVKTDGKSVTIGAPIVKAFSRPDSTPSQALGTMLRHLKGVLASAEELQRLLEKQEKDKE